MHELLTRAGITAPIDHIHAFNSSQSQHVLRVSLIDGSRYVTKIVPKKHRDRLNTEASGLNALKTSGHLLVPIVRQVGLIDEYAVLLMDELIPAGTELSDDEVWKQFGFDLAAHHQTACASSYGWDDNNFIGPTPQPNARCRDWVEFNATHRLGYQTTRAEQAGLIDKHDSDTLHRIVQSLDQFIPRHPNPALLHGDLWSGNAIRTRSDGTARVGLIDPAVYVGDAWADIAMMRLFGGFPEVLFEAYSERQDDHEMLETRVQVYQLYHLLNHLNIFGSGYHRSVLNIANRLTR